MYKGINTDSVPKEATSDDSRQCEDRLSKRISKIECGEKRVPCIQLKWDGKSWKTQNRDIRYQLNLGRDLNSLVERGAIKEDTLNARQKYFIRMYKDLFLDTL